MKEICKAQKLQFEMMKMSSFNKFNGEKIVSLLELNPDLWVGCWMQADDLITLRDIKDNHFNVDTLYILTNVEHQNELFNLVDDMFNADDMGYLADNTVERLLCKSSISNELILKVWWD